MSIETAAGVIIGLLGIGLSVYMHLASKKHSSEQSYHLAQLGRDKSDLERVNADLKKTHDELVAAYALLQEKLPIQQTHTVLLDGMSGAGKTTLAVRLANPIATREKLRTLLATKQEYLTTEMPLCWEKNTRKTILNTIRFYDVAGEYGSTVFNALHHLFEEKRSNELEKRPRKGIVLVIVWDLSDQEDNNQKYMNGYRLEAIYGNKVAKSLIKKIIVFFNKMDEIGPQERERRIKVCSDYIEAVFRDRFEVGYGDLVFCSGSALQGTGLFDCYAEILSYLDLAANYGDSMGSAA